MHTELFLVFQRGVGLAEEPTISYAEVASFVLGGNRPHDYLVVGLVRQVWGEYRLTARLGDDLPARWFAEEDTRLLGAVIRGFEQAREDAHALGTAWARGTHEVDVLIGERPEDTDLLTSVSITLTKAIELLAGSPASIWEAMPPFVTGPGEPLCLTIDANPLVGDDLVYRALRVPGARIRHREDAHDLNRLHR